MPATEHMTVNERRKYLKLVKPQYEAAPRKGKNQYPDPCTTCRQSCSCRTASSSDGNSSGLLHQEREQDTERI